jgi:hypothetical protein
VAEIRARGRSILGRIFAGDGESGAGQGMDLWRGRGVNASTGTRPTAGGAQQFHTFAGSLTCHERLFETFGTSTSVAKGFLFTKFDHFSKTECYTKLVAT